jgi:putative flavoprotein involved in K+ transport
MPRTYRGRDILWWMDAAGILDEGLDQVDDLVRARHLPSMQLSGSRGRGTLDLHALTGRGAQLYGRLVGIRDGVGQFSGSLPNACALADLKLGRLLDSLDGWADDTGAAVNGPPERLPPTRVPASPPLTLDLPGGEVRTIVWATGYRPDLSWLDVPVRNARGQLVHDGGVTRWSGLYLMGMPFLRRRKSTLIDGAAADAWELARHVATHLASRRFTVTAARGINAKEKKQCP